MPENSSVNLVDKFLLSPFQDRLRSPLTKSSICTLQINLGKRCNLACSHCHVEAGPKRTEELSEEVCQQLIQIIQRFPEIQVVDLTGGAPEMLYGFRPLVEAARQANKAVIVRSNLTIYFEPGFEDLPEYCAKQQVRIVASLPCYLSDNVDKMRGHGVYDASIRALQKLTQLGYGSHPQLILDLVYNPPLPTQESQFRLTPNQEGLEQDYKAFLKEQFGIQFNHLLTITNLPIGRTREFLKRQDLYEPYLQFLSNHFNPDTVDGLMCRQQLSVDYQGQIYDCDFNQMAELPALTPEGQPLTITDLLASDRLDHITAIQTRDYCYGCTAGSGSSCGGALL
ncbi:arsenosugar biosynthesis radical SAM (seleno)protein ArsS [Synechococcus elongatus IITB4]|uniref:arsenosugar biosynthesis radical SAM (seleno)protein ArsS n=1 Tax=Synechococcus elongatus TaxID=32046 RepID=UPI0030D05D01